MRDEGLKEVQDRAKEWDIDVARAGAVGSLGSSWSFLAHDEVDHLAEVLFRAGYVGSVADGGCLLPDYVCGEDYFLLHGRA